MLPIIQRGDVFVSVRIPYESLTPGILVVFETPGGIVVHQLDHITKYGWVTKGTNNPGPDIVLMTDSNYRGVIIANFRS